MANNFDKRRILMFAPGFAPYAASENIVNSKLALAFVAAGWDVDIISRFDEGFNYSVEWSEPWMPLRKVTYETRYNAGSAFARTFDIARLSMRLRHPVYGLRWAGRALDLALQLHKKQRYQVILSRSPNDIGHLPAMMFAEKTGLPWVANWNDPPAYFWPRPYEQDSSLFQRCINHRFVKEVLNKATANTFPCVRLKNYFLKNVVEHCPTKVAIIPHVGLQQIEPCKAIRNTKFKIVHAGNLSLERNAATFFNAISRFLKKEKAHETFVLEVIGVQSYELKTLAKKYGLENNLRMAGRIAYLDAVQRLVRNNVLVILEAPCEEGIFLPSKLVDYTQVGRPILAVSPQHGTVSDLLSQHGGGLAADCQSPERIQEALTSLYKSWKENTLERKYGSRHLFKYFSTKTVIKAYEKLFRQLGM